MKMPPATVNGSIFETPFIRCLYSFLPKLSSLPADDELEEALHGAMFQLARRGGYVQSATSSNAPQRKRTQVFLAAGAVLERPFSGALYTVAQGDGHAVYRYSKPMMLGVGF